jgi:hypothetical protein
MKTPVHAPRTGVLIRYKFIAESDQAVNQVTFDCSYSHEVSPYEAKLYPKFIRGTVDLEMVCNEYC